MLIVLLLMLGFPLFVILVLCAIYNGLVKLRNQCREAWSNVDTELKRRYDLIPNLVEVVKGYAKHEREVLAEVVRLRGVALASAGSPGSQAADENQLVQGLRQLLAVAERYPDLKADRHYLELQRELANTEDRIQAARRFFNGNVRDYRNACESFPSNIIAGMFHFQPEEFFAVEPAVRTTVPDVGGTR